MITPLYIGCTAARHAAIGVDAVINARAGRQDLNDLTQQDIEMRRDAAGVRGYLEHRIRWYGPNSRTLRRQRHRLEHLIAHHDD